jgi:hypothetical protein
MSRGNYRIVVALSLPAMASTFFLAAITPLNPIRAQEQDLRQRTFAVSYLELSVEPPISHTGTLITLHITYHNIGMPYTTIQVDPPGLVAFEPPLEMPCKYFEHPTGCTAIALRTVAAGMVTIRAGATGEVYDETCNCWYWSGGTDNGPARLVITDSIWRTFLPSIQHLGELGHGW